MIKIMHIITDSNIGGAGNTLLSLFNAEYGINRSEFDIVVALPQNAKIKPALESMGITCVELPHLAEVSYSRAAIRVLKAEMEKQRPDIVHTHASLSGRVAARRYGKCKIVHTRHSVFEPPNWQKRMKFIFGMINNRYSDVIIAVSPAAKDNLLALGTNPDKIHVIFNGMPPAKEFSQQERAKLREKYNVPQDAFVLAQNARLTEVKGQDDVLDAAKHFPNVLVLMAGDGERRMHLEARIKNENINNVRLLGFVTAIEEILAVMDVQLSASFGTEATSLALIEGMSVGRPAIATDYGGNPYVISHMQNGLIVPTRNPKALADAVNTLYNDSALYAKLATQSREVYASCFTVKEVVSKTEQLYKGLLSNGKN